MTESNIQPAIALDDLLQAQRDDFRLEQQIETLQERRQELASRIKSLKSQVLLEVTFTSATPKETPSGPRLSLIDRVTEFVSEHEGVFTVADVAAAAGIGANQARGCVASLMRVRALRRVGNGQYEYVLPEQPMNNVQPSAR